MSRKIRILGKLNLSEEAGLQFSVSLNQPPDIPASILRYAAKGPRPSLLTDAIQLTLGDFVVHDDHGVAKYVGVRRMESDGKERDFLLLKFADDKRLYVPMERFDLVQKYTGSAPRLDRLEGDEERRREVTYLWASLGVADDTSGMRTRLKVHVIQRLCPLLGVPHSSSLWEF